MIKKNVIAVLDGAAGSCGKAKVISQLVLKEKEKILASVTNCSPNAGHTVVLDNGKKFIFRNIPSASVNKDVALFIAPGSAIDMNIFIKEYESVKDIIGDRKIYVHELVPLIEEKHKKRERRKIKSGSTNHGCGAVLQDKIIRDPNLKFFKGYKNAIVLKNDDWLDLLYSYLEKDGYILLEGSQGTGLSLETSGNYPYVTKENISSANLLNHSMISVDRLLDTILVIRPFPIRISNHSTTGKYVNTGSYGTGCPLFWAQINMSSINGEYPYPEYLENTYGDVGDLKYIKELIKKTPEFDLIDIFGEDYKNFNIENITMTQGLELERRVLTKSDKTYYSKIIEEDIIDLAETTTVTQKERRVFDLDIKKTKNYIKINGARTIYLNFFQYLNYWYGGMKGKFNKCEFDKNLEGYLEWLESEIESVNIGSELACLGTGEEVSEFIKKRSLILNK